MKVESKKEDILLKEIISICDEYNLTCFKGKNMMKIMKKSFKTKNKIKIDVIMPILDMVRFFEICNEQNNKERLIRSMETEPDFPYFGAEYVDKTTTYIDLRAWQLYRNSGISIKIIPVICKSKRPLNIIARGMLSCWHKVNKKPIITKSIKYYTLLLLGVVLKFALREKCAKLIYSFAVKHCCGKERNSCYNVKRIKKNYKTGLLKKNYFKDKKTELGRPSDQIICLTGMSHKNFLLYMNNEEIDLENLLKRRRKVQRKFVAINFFRNYKKKNSDLLRRSNSRYNLYKVYKPKLTLLENLYEGGNYEELNIALSKLNAETDYFLKKRMGFCVDEKLFNLQIALLVKQGQLKKVKKMKKYLIKKHLLPLTGGESDEM